MSEVLWEPPPERTRASALARFVAHVVDAERVAIEGYADLHAWSVDAPDAFWSSVWTFFDVVGDRGSDRVLVDGDRMPGASWFPDARLNFAENLLRRNEGTPALVFQGEDGSRRETSWSALRASVAEIAEGLRAAGVGVGDRVAGYLPNLPETIAAMLATSSIGAVWSSCSPDFGVRGVVDRFGQIEPKVLFAADGYFYNGGWIDCGEKVDAIAAEIPSIRRVVVVPYRGDAGGVTEAPDVVGLADFVAPHVGAVLRFPALPFDHPLYVMYSSGTTGPPKCIVHGAGGTLLKHLVEHGLQCDVGADDRLFYFTTCGWMMWNWLASGLARGATLLLYDGAPTYPRADRLFDLADAERMTVFGTSAKFLDAIEKSGLRPRATHALSSLRTMLSTGSPLVPERFDFVYDAIKRDLHLASISGGTDILGCFVAGAPGLPVRRGETQAPVLGMRVEVYDDVGRPLREGAGELVCRAPFPSMPIGFWNDPDGSRYRKAYFEAYPGVWCHGDFVERTAAGGFVIHGRSDAVLNPGGVRIGTAEIYRQVEQLEEVVEALVIGQRWEGDVRVVLFVRLAEGRTLDEALRDRIKTRIRAHTTPRHVPARVLEVPDIPRTRSGKIVEIAVRSVVHGEPVKNREALANPEALAHFADREELGR